MAADYNLGRLDNESTAGVIRELQQYVNKAEKKCADLMQEINNYKKFYTTQFDNVTSKPKVKKFTKRNRMRSVVLGKETYQDVADRFVEKLNDKIISVNKEISENNRKISLSKNTYVPPTDNEEWKSKFENQLVLAGYKESVSQSDTVIADRGRNDAIIKASHTSLNEKRQCRNIQYLTQRFKLRSATLPKGIVKKFGFGSFIQVNTESEQAMKNHANHGFRIKTKAPTFKTCVHDKVPNASHIGVDKDNRKQNELEECRSRQASCCRIVASLNKPISFIIGTSKQYSSPRTFLPSRSTSSLPTTSSNTATRPAEPAACGDSAVTVGSTSIRLDMKHPKVQPTDHERAFQILEHLLGELRTQKEKAEGFADHIQ